LGIEKEKQARVKPAWLSCLERLGENRDQSKQRKHGHSMAMLLSNQHGICYLKRLGENRTGNYC